MESDFSKVLEEFCEILHEITRVTNDPQNDLAVSPINFRRTKNPSLLCSGEYPLDLQLLGLIDLSIGDTMYVCTEAPQTGSSSEIYKTYMDFDNDQIFPGTDTQLDDVRIIGYSASAFHVFGYDASETPYKFLDTFEANSYFELVVEAAAKIFDLMHPVFLTKHGVMSKDLDFQLRRLGHWYQSLENFDLRRFVEFDKNCSWFANDLYSKNLSQHQADLDRIGDDIELFRQMLLKLEQDGYDVQTKRVESDQISIYLPHSFKTFISEIGELQIFKKKPSINQYPCLKIFVPAPIESFLENKASKQTRKKLEKSKEFINLRGEKIMTSELLFVSCFKDEVGAFQTNKYLQYPFLTKEGLDQDYPASSKKFFEWLKMCLARLN